MGIVLSNDLSLGPGSAVGQEISEPGNEGGRGLAEPGDMPFIWPIRPEGLKQVHQTVNKLTSRMLLRMNAPKRQQRDACEFSCRR